jgi:hypothetical protein
MRTQINQSPLQARSTQVAISRLRRRKVHPKQQQQNDTNASQQVHEPAPQNTQAHHCCSLLTKETKIEKKHKSPTRDYFCSQLLCSSCSTDPRAHASTAENLRSSAATRGARRSDSLASQPCPNNSLDVTYPTIPIKQTFRALLQSTLE